MSIFGTSPLGTDLGPAGGMGLITVLGLLPLSNNKWIVVWDRPPKSLDPTAVTSGTNPENYTLEAIDPTITAPNGDKFVPDGEYVPTRFPYTATAEVDKIDPTQIILASDSTLQQFVDYQVTISPSICGANDETFAGPNVFTFRAPRLSSQLTKATQISEQRYRDFDYVIAPKQGELGQTYRIEASGDIGIQDAEVSLKKRVYRRIFTNPGGFAWLPNYGVGMGIKKLVKSGQLQDLSNRIAAQIQQEPDVISAGVEVFRDNTSQGSFVQVEAYIQRSDSRTSRFTFREPAP